VEPQIYYLSAGHGLPVDLYTRHSAAPELVCIYFESSDQSKWVIKLEFPEQLPTFLYLKKFKAKQTKYSNVYDLKFAVCF